MANIGLGGMLPDFSGILVILMYAGIALIIGLILGGALYLFIIKANQKKVYEINMITKKVIPMAAVEKRNRSKKKQLFIPKIKRFLPNTQQEDIFLQGGKDTVFLLKDNNGLYHSLRLPTMDQYMKWLKDIEGIDITEKVKEIEGAETEDQKMKIFDKIKLELKGIKTQKALDVIGTIYLMPNPMENIEWLADEQNQSLLVFGSGLLRHPALLFVGTMMVSGLIFILSLVVTKMM